MKRKQIKICCCLLSVALLCGCAPAKQNLESSKSSSDSSLQLVTTLFCYYDFARAILKNTDTISVQLLLSPGMESHSFEPTPSDILAIQDADIFLYNGGHMEEWVTKILEAEEQPNPNQVVRCMMDFAPLLEETELEGSESEHSEHDHEHEHEEEHSHEHEGESDIEYDEHIWTSPVIAKDLLYVTCNAICEADPDHATIYRSHADAYAEQLEALDADFSAYFSDPDHRTLLFADKFPLQYFANTYGLHCYAAFSGCSSDTEPSVATISRLMNLVKEEQLSKVYYFEVSSPAVAEVIGEETGTTPTVFQSCHTITEEDFENGETYVSLMRRNLEALSSN